MEKRLIVYTTDVHGKTTFIEKMLELSAKHKVKAIILNGDLTPDEYFMDILAQRSFFELFLIPAFKKFKKKHDIEIFVLMGNHDYSVNMDVFYEAEKNKVFNVLHNEVHEFDGFEIVGYSFINPVGLWDWEKTEQEIKKDLDKLKKKLDFKRTIFVSHSPPYNTNLDMVFSKRHVGSKSIREFIKENQPYLGLHGHIHESPQISGSMKDKIGKTLCVNPGNAQLVLIDLDTLEIKKI